MTEPESECKIDYSQDVNDSIVARNSLLEIDSTFTGDHDGLATSAAAARGLGLNGRISIEGVFHAIIKLGKAVAGVGEDGNRALCIFGVEAVQSEA